MSDIFKEARTLPELYAIARKARETMPAAEVNTLLSEARRRIIQQDIETSDYKKIQKTIPAIEPLPATKFTGFEIAIDGDLNRPIIELKDNKVIL